MREDKYIEEIRDTIFSLLDSEKYDVFIFGSRATGEAGKFSDYDIGIIGTDPVPSSKKVLIEEALEESNIPYKVDIVDFSLVSPEFREIALSQTKKI
jgi:uncharacterized protein